MAKLTKEEYKKHEKALEILKNPLLSDDDKEFVIENWHEGANHINSKAGAFFTPFSLALDFAFDVGGPRIIDLCAGIGNLSYAKCIRHNYYKEVEKTLEITCVELNPDYVEIGKKILPEANWICGSIFDVLDMDLGHFDYAISNPPFGNISRNGKTSPGYSGKDFEFHVIDIASRIADYGTFIVPQMSAGFRYSGNRYYERQSDGKAFEFQKKTGLYFEAGIGVDTEIYRKDWNGVSPLCEIVCIDFTNKSVDM